MSSDTAFLEIRMAFDSSASSSSLSSSADCVLFFNWFQKWAKKVPLIVSLQNPNTHQNKNGSPRGCKPQTETGSSLSVQMFKNWLVRWNHDRSDLWLESLQSLPGTLHDLALQAQASSLTNVFLLTMFQRHWLFFQSFGCTILSCDSRALQMLFSVLRNLIPHCLSCYRFNSFIFLFKITFLGMFSLYPR